MVVRIPPSLYTCIACWNNDAQSLNLLIHHSALLFKPNYSKPDIHGHFNKAGPTWADKTKCAHAILGLASQTQISKAGTRNYTSHIKCCNYLSLPLIPAISGHTCNMFMLLSLLFQSTWWNSNDVMPLSQMQSQTKSIASQKYTQREMFVVLRQLQQGILQNIELYEHLARYVKLWVAHAPGRPRTFSLATAG